MVILENYCNKFFSTCTNMVFSSMSVQDPHNRTAQDLFRTVYFTSFIGNQHKKGFGCRLLYIHLARLYLKVEKGKTFHNKVNVTARLTTL